MSLKAPLVFGSDGVAQQLQAGDTLSSTWSGTATIAAGTIALGALATATASVATTTGSGTLKAGTPAVVGVTGLPAGLQSMGGSVTADGQVTVFLRASVLVTISAPATIPVTAVQPR